jgi:UDP-N-acetylmuramate--alanine ligase
MCALAQVSAEIEGATITGSDIEERFFTDIILEQAQIQVLPFAASNVEQADLVVASPAYNDLHPEIARAKELKIPVLSDPQSLGRLMFKKRGIAVTGTHGKTTATAMIGLILMEAGLDPTIVVGSNVPSLGGNAHSGQGEFFLAESCEYRRHFLNYSPEYLIITNIDFDHPDYFRDLQDVILAFQEMAGKVSVQGHIFMSADDPNCQAIQSPAAITTFGLSAAADIRAADICCKNEVSTMKIYADGKYLSLIHI